MSTKRSEHTSLAGAIVDLEAIDAALATMAAAQPSGPITEARAQIRAAISILSNAQTAAEEPATTKRRVKIKAVGDSATTTGTAAGKPAAKSSSKRGRAASEPAPPAAPTSSLLARLGAAAATSSDVPGENNAAAPKSGGLSAGDAADRLARLEAEIDSLTRPPATVAGTPPAAKTVNKSVSAAAAAPASVLPAAAPPQPAPEPHAALDDDDDDGAEITIIDPGSSTSGRPAEAGRHGPRVYRDAVLPAEEDAEVEIVRPGEGGRRAPHADGLRTDPRAAPEAAKGTARGRWSLFRGSR